jgi:hypothetical protein
MTAEDKLLARAERAEAIDMRWRPLRNTPRDGRTVEVLYDDGRQSFWKFFKSSPPAPRKMIAWRPAHPDWQEESG